MKNLIIALIVSAGAMGFASGCATPAYSGGYPTMQYPSEKATGENANAILRGWHLDARQVADDFNAVLLLSEPSHLTKWNAR